MEKPMQILKTYARMFVNSLDESLPFLERLVGKPADLRFPFGAIEIAAIGDFLVLAGLPEETEKYRTGVGPLIVADIDAAEAFLVQHGAIITQPRVEVPTGVNLYARHPDGTNVEYVEWVPELTARIIGKES
jgi:hypothetical protein